MYKSLKNRYKPERPWKSDKVTPFPFEGDIPFLQFINTYRNRGTSNWVEQIETYDVFLDWCQEFKIIEPDEQNTLSLEGYCYADEANFVRLRAIKLREAVCEFIDSPLRGREINEDAVAFFNGTLAEANAHLRFELNGDNLEVTWFDTVEQLAAPLWILTKQAETLMLSANFKDIKKCHCGKFYLDTTRNKTRRWCNPLVCGNAVRTKNYKERKRLMELVPGDNYKMVG